LKHYLLLNSNFSIRSASSPQKKGMTTPDATAQRVVYDTIQHIGNWVASFFPVTWLLWVKERVLYGWGSLWGLGVVVRCDGYLFSFRFSFVHGFSPLSSGPFGFINHLTF